MEHEKAKKFLKQFGLKPDAGVRGELAEEMLEQYSAEELFRGIVAALSDDEALAALEYFHRINK